MKEYKVFSGIQEASHDQTTLLSTPPIVFAVRIYILKSNLRLIEFAVRILLLFVFLIWNVNLPYN